MAELEGVRVVTHDSESDRNEVPQASRALRKKNLNRWQYWCTFALIYTIIVICIVVGVTLNKNVLYGVIGVGSAAFVVGAFYAFFCNFLCRGRKNILFIYCLLFTDLAAAVTAFTGLSFEREFEFIYLVLALSLLAMLLGSIMCTCFLCLTFRISHIGAGDPECHYPCLQPVLRRCPSVYISVKPLLPRREGQDTEPVCDIANVENRNPADQDAGAIIHAPDSPETQMEGLKNAPILYFSESSDISISRSSRQSTSCSSKQSTSCSSKQSLSVPSSNVASDEDLDSIPTDSNPYSFTRGSSTSSQITVLAAGSLSEMDDPFSDENSQQGTSEGLGGEQAGSPCETSEGVSQLEQDIVAGEKTTSACQGSEEMASPRLVEKAEMVESSSEEVPK